MGISETLSEVSSEQVLHQVVAVLKEGYYGPQASWSYYTDAGPEAGLQGTLERVTAEQASRKVGETTIAAHTFHVGFSFEVTEAWLRGDRSPRDWPGSWRVNRVEEEDWRNLRAQVKEKFERLVRTVEGLALSDEQSLGAAIGATAHLAYHLGAIRQKLPLAAGGG